MEPPTGATTPTSPSSQLPVAIIINPPLTIALRDAIEHTWVEVTNAGGAVGFLAPISTAVVALEAAALYPRIEAGHAHLLVATYGEQLAGWVLLDCNVEVMTTHWAWVKHLQVRPAWQGQGIGRSLLNALRGLAGDQLGLRQLYLTVRGGIGLEAYYLAAEFREVGRMPRSLCVADGDYRDEIYMVLELA